MFFCLLNVLCHQKVKFYDKILGCSIEFLFLCMYEYPK